MPLLPVPLIAPLGINTERTRTVVNQAMSSPSINQVTFTVGQGVYILVIEISVVLNTDATVGNRTVRLFTSNPGTSNGISYQSGLAQAASTTFRYTWGSYLSADSLNVGTVKQPIPSLLLPPQTTFNIGILGTLGAADAFAFPTITYNEFLWDGTGDSGGDSPDVLPVSV